MTYIAYLDEFGHVGPYVGREDPRHNDSPVFGLAGFTMPVEQVRGFGTWFFQRKCELLNSGYGTSENRADALCDAFDCLGSGNTRSTHG